MTKRFHKHKILLDENVHYRVFFPLLNNLFDVIDKKLTAFFRKATLKSLLGKLTTVTGETEV